MDFVRRHKEDETTSRKEEASRLSDNVVCIHCCICKRQLNICGQRGNRIVINIMMNSRPRGYINNYLLLLLLLLSPKHSRVRGSGGGGSQDRSKYPLLRPRDEQATSSRHSLLGTNNKANLVEEGWVLEPLFLITAAPPMMMEDDGRADDFFTDK